MNWCSKCADFHAGEACGDLEVVIPEGTTWLEKGSPTVEMDLATTPTCRYCQEKDHEIEKLKKAVAVTERRRKAGREYQRKKRALASS